MKLGGVERRDWVQIKFAKQSETPSKWFFFIDEPSNNNNNNVRQCLAQKLWIGELIRNDGNTSAQSDREIAVVGFADIQVGRSR